MTASELAALQARAYTDMAPWSVGSFASALNDPLNVLHTSCSHAFLLARVIGDEAEILIVATDPDQQRRGFARSLITRFHDTARSLGATRVFLEVAAHNTPAVQTYLSCGYRNAGTRKNYYRLIDGTHADAHILTRDLTPGRV